MFTEEYKRVRDALAGDGIDMLAILPGKHLLSIFANSISGLRGTHELTDLVLRALSRNHLKKDDPLLSLGQKVEAALLSYLPSRRMKNVEIAPNESLQPTSCLGG